jgi:hypothetical protein
MSLTLSDVMHAIYECEEKLLALERLGWWLAGD